MAKYSLEVIPAPQKTAKSVFISNNKIQFFKGNGVDNYYCGSCGFLLCESVHRSQIVNIVLKCPSCLAYNELKGT